MELASKVLFQVLVMLILITVGVIAYRVKLVSDEGKKQISNILMYVVMPAVILNAYCGEFDPTLVSGLLWSLALSVMIHLLGILISAVCFRSKADSRNALAQFCAIYSNCGFMAIPLIQSLLGDVGVFYASAHITVYNLLSWTQGVILLTGKTSKKAVAKAFLSPTIIAAAVGLLIFFFRIPVLDLIRVPLQHISALNTPVAMIVVGISIAQTNLLSCLTDRKIYAVFSLRNLLIPAITLVILRFLPLDDSILICALIEAACPTAAASVMFATKFGLDDGFASKVIAATTVLSVLTIPFMVFLFQLGR